MTIERADELGIARGHRGPLIWLTILLFALVFGWARAGWAGTPSGADDIVPPSPTTARITNVTIDLRKQGTPFGGWGTSLAWWAHRVGQWPDQPLDRLVHLIVDPGAGLGLNVFRYNIGGGDRPDHHHIHQWADMPGFRRSPDAPYDWSADGAQRRVLMKLIDATRRAAGSPAAQSGATGHALAGLPVIEAFSNSPPWWMTISGCSAGALDGGANLAPGREADFAGYLADVVAHLKSAYHVPIHSLEPFNEPDADWWTAGSKQEGMHVPRDQQARLIRLTRAALDARGLQSVLVSANDANNLDNGLASLLSFDPPTLAALGQVNIHSYTGSHRDALRHTAGERHKPLWQSESGPLHFSGTQYQQVLKMAQRIVIDINHLQPKVWCTWQVLDHGPWGCFHVDGQDRQVVQPAKMFYMLGEFTRHVRPGDRFVPLESDCTLAAISARRAGEVTIVLVNPDPQPRTFRVSLRGAATRFSSASGDRTTKNDNAATIPAIPVHDGAFELDAPASSVTRLTLEGQPN